MAATASLTFAELRGIYKNMGIGPVSSSLIEKERVFNVDPQELPRFFFHYTKALGAAKVTSGEQVGNIDEVAFDGNNPHAGNRATTYGVDEGKQDHLLHPSGSKSPGSTLAPIVMASGTVAGGVFLTTYPLPPKKIPAVMTVFLDFLKRNNIDVFSGKESAYMNVALLEEFLPRQLKAYMEKIGLSPDQGLVLLIDGHRSRYSLPLWMALREINVHLVLLPAHTSHILQTIDTSLAKRMKARGPRLSDFDVKEMERLRTSRAVVHFCRHIVPIYNALGMGVIVAAWLKNGLFPLQPERIDNRDFLRAIAPKFLDTVHMMNADRVSRFHALFRRLATAEDLMPTIDLLKSRRLGGFNVTLDEHFNNVVQRLQRQAAAATAAHGRATKRPWWVPPPVAGGGDGGASSADASGRKRPSPPSPDPLSSDYDDDGVERDHSKQRRGADSQGTAAPPQRIAGHRRR